MAVQRDVAIRYSLEYADKGLARAITTTRQLEQASQKAGAAVTLASRRQADAWKLVDREARQFDTAMSQRMLSQSSAVSRSATKQVEALRKLGSGYKDITAMARAAGASAEQTAALIGRAASKEEAAYARIERARRTLKAVPSSLVSGSGGVSGRSAVAEARGATRGALRGTVRTGAAFLGGGLLGFVSVQGMKTAIDQTKELGLATRNLTAMTGMSNKEAASWVAITQARGISTRTFGMTLKTLSTQTENAMNGSKASVKTFQALGISHKEVTAHAHDLSGMLGVVADHLNKMPGGVEKTALASKLLGRNWMALLPVMAEGSKGMAAQRREAAALGVQLGGDSATNAKKLEEASVRLKIAQMGLSVQFTEHIAPALMTLTSGAIKLAVAIGHELTPVFHTLSPVVKDVGHWLGEHKALIGAVVGAYAGFKIIRTVGGWFGGLINDGKRTIDFFRGLGGIVKEPLSMFRAQQTETEKLTVSMDQLAVALERVSVAQKGVAVSSETAMAGEAGMGATGAMGGAAGLKGAAGKAAVTEATMMEGSALTMAEGGLVGTMFGRQGLTNLSSKIGGLASGAMKGAGIAGMGVLGAQMVGSMIPGSAGRTVSRIGTGAALGAGLGSVIPGLGTLAGGAIGAGLGALASLGNASDNLKKEMTKAAQAGNSDKLRQLADEAAKASVAVAHGARSFSQADPAMAKLATAARTAAGLIDQRKAAPIVAGTLQAQSGARTVDQQLQAITPGLAKLPASMRNLGAQASIQLAAGMEQQGRLPRGATDRLITDLERKYPPLATYLARQGAASMQAIADNFRVNKVQSSATNLIDAVHKTFTFLPTYAETAGNSTQDKMTTTMKSLKVIIATGTADQRAAATDELGKLEQTYKTYMDALAQRTQDAMNAAKASITSMGGDWNSLGSVVQTVVNQQIVPAINTASSSITSFLGVNNQLTNAAATPTLPPIIPGRAGGGYVVPGDPTRDGTLILAAGNEVVLTGHGQQMLHQEAPGLLDHVVSSQLPHFATGGSLGWTTTGSSSHSRGGSHRASHPRASHPRAAHHAATPHGRVVTASDFGGPNDPSAYMHSTASGKIMNSSLVGYAELSNPPGSYNYSALGHLPMGTPLAVTYGGKTITIPKVDVGKGGPGLNGHIRAIDLTQPAANMLGFPGLADVLIGGTGAATLTSTTAPKNTTITTFVPAGKGLADGFDAGYFYGIDPTASGVTSPGSALQQATLGASLRAVKKTVSSASAAAAAAGGTSGAATGALGAMIAKASWIDAQHYPYVYGGGHGSFAGPYDCSGAVSAVLHSGNLLGAPEATGALASFGQAGLGRNVSVFVENSSAGGGHTIMSLNGRLFGTSGSRGGNWLAGSNPTSYSPIGHWENVRHPPGMRRGGHIPTGKRTRLPGPIMDRFPGRPNSQQVLPGLRRGGHLPRFRAGGHTSHKPAHITTPARHAAPGGIHIATGGRTVLPALPAAMQYTQIGALQQDLALMPIEAVNIGVRTSRAAVRAVTKALGTIVSTPNNAKIRQAFGQLSAAISNVGTMSYAGLQHTADAIQQQINHFTTTTHRHLVGKPHHRHLVTTSTPRHMTSGEQRQVTRLKNALQLVDYQMGVRAGNLVKVAENEASAIQTAQTKLTRLMTRRGIDQASAEGTAMLAAFDDQAVAVLKDTVAKLQKAYRMAQKAGDTKALSDIGQKLKDALDNLDQAVTDAVAAHRTAVEAAAQAPVDAATHGVTMAQAGEQGLELRQQLAGTFGSGAGVQAQSQNILSTIVPALQAQVAALTQQQAAAQSVGDQVLATQIGEAIATSQNSILQAQLDAQNAIKQNTAAMVASAGDLGVSYQSQNLPDLAGVLNGL